jgi:predicted RNase H-like HicB family nuclease
VSENEYWVTMAIQDGDAKHAWSVFFPDLPGCYSAGDTLQEAIDGARDAVMSFAIDALQQGGELPAPRSIEHWKRDPEFAGPGWTWHLAKLDLSEILGPPERVNVIVPRSCCEKRTLAGQRTAVARKQANVSHRPLGPATTVES